MDSPTSAALLAMDFVVTDKSESQLLGARCNVRLDGVEESPSAMASCSIMLGAAFVPHDLVPCWQDDDLSRCCLCHFRENQTCSPCYYAKLQRVYFN